MRSPNPDEGKARAEAYRAGLCVTCKTVPHSAGRPRCEVCHQTHIARGGERV
jgi:hypothetical protein